MKRGRPKVLKKLPPPPPETQVEPGTPKEMAFCERWLVHHDALRAYQEAGYSKVASGTRSQRKLRRFHDYLQRRIPKVEQVVAQRIGYERADILEGIARIANANALDYIVPYTVIDAATGEPIQTARLKNILELTRDQAAALDRISHDPVSGKISYSLPEARTRLAAFTTLGEQAAGFSKKECDTHNHLHLNVEPEKLQHIKGLLIDAVGIDVARKVFGMEPVETAEPEIERVGDS